MAFATPELDILHPRDPSLEDSDDWEEFTIRNAVVHESGNENDLVSLLTAEAGYPVTVTGDLEPLDRSNYNLYVHGAKSFPRPISIVVENVRQFAFGQEDGFSVIWAAGKAGWHRLQPAKKYTKIYDEMCEAVSVLYFIADAYTTARFEGRGMNKALLRDYSAKELFAKYAQDVLRTEDAEAAVERIYRHKDFLISSMLAGREGLAWSKYPLTKHLYKRFPDTVATMKKRREAPWEPEAPAVTSRETRAQSSGTSSTAISKPRKARSAGQNSAEPLTRTAASSDGARSRKLRQGSVESSSTPGSKNTKRRRAQRAGEVEIISLDDTSDADGTIPEDPEDEQMEEGEESVAATGQPNGIPGPTRRTRHNQVAVESEHPEFLATPAKDEESDEEIRVREQKNKSSLRPRASKASKSSVRNGGKGPRKQLDDDDEDEPDPPSSPVPGKRKYMDERDDAGRRQLKRHHSRPHDDEGIDIPTSPESSGADVDLPLRLAKMAHTEDPVQEDTWVCALDGCSHKVYAASHPDSQRLIRSHYALHAYDDDERVQMVKKVEAPSLPVGRLMEKVKMRAKADGFPSSAVSAPSMPENVRSRYGIVGQVGVVQRY